MFLACICGLLKWVMHCCGDVACWLCVLTLWVCDALVQSGLVVRRIVLWGLLWGSTI